MDKIKQQVNRARRRLIAEQFLRIVAWSLFASLLIAAVGLAIPKIWVVAADPQVWHWSWVGGGIGAGLLLGFLWTFLVRRSVLDAAIEVDRRCGLKERVSSSLSLHPEELDTEAGQALLADAQYRMERIDVRDSFPVQVRMRSLLPLLSAAAVAIVMWLPNATPPAESNASATTTEEAERVQRSAQELKKRLAEVEKKIQEQGLVDAELLLKELEKGASDLANRSDLDRKQAMAKMNNMAQELEKRKEQLGGLDKMRNQLNNLKNIQQGPADEIAKAMQDGDFGKALDELKELQKQLQKDELNDEQKKALAEQLDQLQNKLQDMVDAHNQAKQDLQEEIQRRQDAGDLQGAGELQRQLDQLNAMNEQMNNLQNMANQLGQCGQCLQNGDANGAGAQLEQLANTLEEMQAELEQLETLDEMLDQIAQCKQAMNCGQCNGAGCKACMGGMGGQGQGQGNGFGLGEGQGQGERPEERTDTSMYETQVRGELQPGESVRTGTAGGPNRAGRSLEEVKAEIQANLTKDTDPLTDIRLPKKEREQTKEYFERYQPE